MSSSDRNRPPRENIRVSASTAGQTKAEVLAFSLVKISLGVMIEVFGDPEFLAVFGDNAIDTLTVAAGHVFFLRGHKDPFVDCTGMNSGAAFRSTW